MSNYFFSNAELSERIDQKILYVSSDKYIDLSNLQPAEERSTDNKTSFSEVAGAWLKWIEPRLKLSSKNKYEYITNCHLLPEFGSFFIEDISRTDVTVFRDTLMFRLESKLQTPLSSATISGILSVLKSIFRFSSDELNLKVFDIGGISVKTAQKPLQILSQSEQQILSDYLFANYSSTHLGILISLYMGLRLGEVCALQWQDVSFADQTIFVRQTMQRLRSDEDPTTRTKVIISEPKSGQSVRHVPIPDKLMHLFWVLNKEDGAFVLSGKKEKVVEPRTMQNRFKTILRKCGIRDINYHALRHTFATRSVEVGCDVKSLSEILGHASVGITLNRYVHPSMKIKKEQINRVSDLFSD
ncbi:MAG: site-specific integrase [Eubacteriaceae bacterium]|nr:site-specific integrase [Eubacteriaceae bacterium]